MTASTRRPRIGFVSTYPPTVCGLATFTASLRGAIARNRGTHDGLGVLRLVDGGRETSAEAGVRVHRRGDRRSLLAGARTLDTFDAVSVQHEFGIYGGRDGREVLDLVAAVDVPVVTTFHTMLADPTAHQRRVIEDLAAASRRSVVMSGTAAERLIRYYDVDPERVVVIPHGAAARFRGPSLAGGDRPLILTWGLIGPGKGLEVAIEACTHLLDLAPRPRYLIAGATHPNVLRNDGEAYREGLVASVRRLGLEDVVEFDDRYLEDAELARLVRSADLVVLPYASVEQVTSGVLVEAISASKPVIATTFPHSVEVLSSGAGILVPHGDPRGAGCCSADRAHRPPRHGGHGARGRPDRGGVGLADDRPALRPAVRRADGSRGPRHGVPQRVGVDHVAG
jgi:polysaccharide biosynthesis protein PslF